MKRIYSLMMAIVIMFTLYAPSAGTLAEQGIMSQPALSDVAIDVKAAQTRLISLGFLTGEADGIAGANTEKAVLAFQKYAAANGYALDQDGFLGQQTYQLLFDKGLGERRITLRMGDDNALVKKMQTRLVKLGYMFDKPDGQFGGGTERALKAFQNMLVAEGIADASASGIADSVTRDYLFDRDLTGFNIETPVFYDSSRPGKLAAGHLYSEVAVLMDADTGKVLFDKNGSRKAYPASTTKVMTLICGLEKVKLNGTVTVPDEAGKVPSDSSRVPVYPGEKMPYEDLLYGLMLRSGNDAANAVAVLTSGSISKFADAMNDKAEELGMINTHFTNAHGYHSSDHYSTAVDMAKLMRAAANNQQAMQIMQTRSHRMAATAKRKQLTIASTYSIANADSGYYYKNYVGGKSGYTSAAGQCFVSVAKKNGRRLIAVTMGCRTSSSDRWLDVARLFEYGYAG